MPNPLEGVDTSNAPYVIVSSDTHAGLYVENYRDYLESRYHPQFDEWLLTRHEHRRVTEEMNGEYVEQWERENEEGLRGAYDPEVRDKELDADGISGEVIFADGDAVTGMESPPFGAGLAAGQITDPGLAWAGAWAHNRWLEEFCSTNPPRRAGVALVPIVHGVEESVREIEALAGKPGVKGIMIPTMWHDNPSYGGDHYDPIWAACAEAGLVVHTHSGEADHDAYNENMAQYMLEVAFWTHRPLWQLLLSGKFDKFPNLKYVPVECGSWWLGDLLFKTDSAFGGTNWKVKKMAARTEGLIERLPSEYIGTNVFIGASTMSKVELRRRYVNGVDALMWGTDYPHPEGSWPHTVERLETDFREIPVAETRLLLGLNAVRCYDLDLDGLDEIAAVGPTPEQLHQDLDLRTPPNAYREARFWFDDYGIAWPE